MIVAQILTRKYTKLYSKNRQTFNELLGDEIHEKPVLDSGKSLSLKECKQIESIIARLAVLRQFVQELCEIVTYNYAVTIPRFFKILEKQLAKQKKDSPRHQGVAKQ